MPVSGRQDRWPVLRATFLAYFYDSYNLAILSVVMPSLIATLHIDTAIGGLLHSATMVGAAVGSVLIGILVQRRDKRFVLSLCLTIIGISTALVYFAASWPVLAGLFFLVGLGVGGVWGPCVALIKDYWAPQYTARAVAFMLSTFAVGWIAASFLGRLALATDWRLLFVFGSTSIFAALYVRRAVPADCSATDAGTKTNANGQAGLSAIFAPDTARITVLATVVNACQMAGFWGVGAWIPTYLVLERGLRFEAMSSFLVLMYAGVFCGYQIFGFLADKIGRRKIIAFCFGLNCLTIPMYLLVSDPGLMFKFAPVMGLPLGGLFGVSGAFYAELFPARIRVLASGFCFNIGRLGAVPVPFTVGLAGKYYGLSAGLAASPILFFIGGLMVLMLPETLAPDDSSAAFSEEAQ
jgi:MFS family permease